MIVTPRVRSQKTSLALRPVEGVAESVCTRRIDSIVQMLQGNERSSLLDTGGVSLTVSSHGGNNFSVLCGTVSGAKFTPEWRGWVSADAIELMQLTPSEVHPSVLSVLSYMRAQLIPMYATCCSVTARMQEAFGSIALQYTEMQNKPVDDTFMKNNACVISKATDMLNSGAGDAHRAHRFQDAARLVWLASTFCATASAGKKFSLFHASQLQMAEMSEYMVERLYEQAPEKQHVTTLMRGPDASSRISRFNVAVRVFAPDSEMVRELMPGVVGLNTRISSPVMVFTGIRNNQAAAVYLSSDTLDSTAHKAAVNGYYCDGVADKK